MTFMSKETNTNASPIQTFRVSVAPQPKLPIDINNKVRSMASQAVFQNTQFFDVVGLPCCGALMLRSVGCDCCECQYC